MNTARQCPVCALRDNSTCLNCMDQAAEWLKYHGLKGRPEQSSSGGFLQGKLLPSSACDVVTSKSKRVLWQKEVSHGKIRESLMQCFPRVKVVYCLGAVPLTPWKLWNERKLPNRAGEAERHCVPWRSSLRVLVHYWLISFCSEYCKNWNGRRWLENLCRLRTALSNYAMTWPAASSGKKAKCICAYPHPVGEEVRTHFPS